MHGSEVEAEKLLRLKARLDDEVSLAWGVIVGFPEYDYAYP